MTTFNQLRVLSFNIWGLGFGIAKDRGLRVRAFVDALPDLRADVIGLQEVWVEADRQLIAARAAAVGLEYAHYFRSGFVGSGLMILSRYPIVETSFRQFTLKSRPERVWEGDFFAGKGIGVARLGTPYGPIDVYTLHPVAQYAPDDEDPYVAHRSAAMYESASFINVTSAQHPAIVTGDFNVTPQQPGYDILTNLACLTDSFAMLHPDDPGITFSNGNFYNQNYRAPARLDYVFLRGNESLALHPLRADITLDDMPAKPGKPYSDHYGLLVDVGIASAQGRPPASDPQRVQQVLETFAHTLDKARLRTNRRRLGTLARFVAFLALSVTFSARKTGASVPARLVNSLAIVPFALLQGLLGIVNQGEEIQGMRALRAEVDLRLRQQLEVEMEG